MKNTVKKIRFVYVEIPFPGKADFVLKLFIVSSFMNGFMVKKIFFK